MTVLNIKAKIKKRFRRFIKLYVKGYTRFEPIYFSLSFWFFAVTWTITYQSNYGRDTTFYWVVFILSLVVVLYGFRAWWAIGLENERIVREGKILHDRIMNKQNINVKE